MLSRVADALFWMSRYLERAEHVARLLDVCFHLDLDLHGLLASRHELHWRALVATIQPGASLNNGPVDPETVAESLMFNLSNPESVMSCINRARYNARSVRGTINSEMWKELNKLYWQLCDEQFCAHARESPHDFYQAVESGSHLVQGVCDATLTHDEGWQFIQLGKYLERADKTLRILDVQHRLLNEMPDPMDLSLSNLLWGAVLRSCRAYEAYQTRYVGRIEPEHVLELLLLHRTFPRSVLFCLESVASALEKIEIHVPDRDVSPADRIIGRLTADLRYLEMGEIIDHDLHWFLRSALENCAAASRAIQEQYSFHYFASAR
ncbi:MAG TPA: alpha-E domain-containing protein [Pirellulales bacterium]|nr:alpha-E domain-containing protein [Pirellulales bacterium]